MKKYDKLFLIIGILLSTIPIYHFFGWIYVWNKYYETRGREEVSRRFNENVFCNLIPATDYWKFGLVLLFIGVVAGIFLLSSMMESLNNPHLKIKKLNLIIFIINIIFTFWIAWGLM